MVTQAYLCRMTLGVEPEILCSLGDVHGPHYEGRMDAAIIEAIRKQGSDPEEDQYFWLTIGETGKPRIHGFTGEYWEEIVAQAQRARVGDTVSFWDTEDGNPVPDATPRSGVVSEVHDDHILLDVADDGNEYAVGHATYTIQKRVEDKPSPQEALRRAIDGPNGIERIINDAGTMRGHVPWPKVRERLQRLADEVRGALEAPKVEVQVPSLDEITEQDRKERHMDGVNITLHGPPQEIVDRMTAGRTKDELMTDMYMKILNRRDPASIRSILQEYLPLIGAAPETRTDPTAKGKEWAEKGLTPAKAYMGAVALFARGTDVDQAMDAYYANRTAPTNQAPPPGKATIGGKEYEAPFDEVIVSVPKLVAWNELVGDLEELGFGPDKVNEDGSIEDVQINGGDVVDLINRYWNRITEGA